MKVIKMYVCASNNTRYQGPSNYLHCKQIKK